MADTDMTQDTKHVSFLDVAVLLAENARALVLFPLAAGLFALGLSFLIGPTFTSTARLLPPQQQQSLAAALATQLGALAGPASTVAGLKNPADMYIAMLKSRTVADRLIARFGLKQLFEMEFDEQARQTLASRTTMTAGRDGLIVISVDDHNPKRAADLANAYVEELSALTRNLALTEASQRRLFYEEQMKQANDNLTRAELALKGAGINEATLNTVPQSALEFVADLKAKVTAQEIKLASLGSSMTESNPQFRQARGELAALRAQLARIEKSDGVKSTGDGTDYVARLRDFKYYESLFDLTAKQYELARLDEAREGALIQVVDAAVPPELKSKPKRALIAILVTLATFIVTVLFVVAREALQASAAEPGNAGKVSRLRELLHLRRT